MFYVWHPKNQIDLKTIHEVNNIIETKNQTDLKTIHEVIIETQQELANVKKQLKQDKNTCLIMRMEHPRAWEIR